jgi:RNA polymerase sigma-70 factor (ECF subfamily)
MEPAPTDEALLDAWRRGDEGAFEMLFLRYRDGITSYAARMTRRREEGEEICLEAFARVASGAWKPTGRFRSFIFTTAHRLALDRIKRQGRAGAGNLRIAAEGVAQTSVEDDLVEREQREQLEAAVSRLPESHRSVLLLYYGNELPSKEVAEILGLDDQVVRSRLAYCRRVLRQELVASEGDLEVNDGR